MTTKAETCEHPNKRFAGSGPYNTYESHWCEDCGALIRTNSIDLVEILDKLVIEVSYPAKD